MTNNMFSDKKDWAGNAGPYNQKALSALLLMTVLSKSFFTLMRRNLMTLSFFTTRHKTPMNLVKQ